MEKDDRVNVHETELKGREQRPNRSFLQMLGKLDHLILCPRETIREDAHSYLWRNGIPMTITQVS